MENETLRAELKAKYTLSDFWVDCLLEIKRSQENTKKSPSQLIASIKSVSRSGMSRKMKFGFIRENGRFQDVTILFATLYGVSLNDDYTITIRGCGMDMIFHVLYTVWGVFGENSDYSYFCRYEQF